MNDDFYNTAFTSDQQTSIKTTTLDNSAYNSQYDSATTKDKVFLLSYNEALNTSYGSDAVYSTYGFSKTGVAQGSAYAKCQGLSVDSYGASCWRLRSPGNSSNNACEVIECNFVSSIYDVYSTNDGIRPALKISNLSSLVVVGNINGNETNAVVPENNNEIIYIAIIAAVILGIVFNIVIIFVATKKKKSRKSNTALNSDIEEKSAKTDKQSDETEKISDKPKTSKRKSKPMQGLMKIISYAPLTDEQLEAINKKLNPKN